MITQKSEPKTTYRIVNAISYYCCFVPSTTTLQHMLKMNVQISFAKSPLHIPHNQHLHFKVYFDYFSSCRFKYLQSNYYRITQSTIPFLRKTVFAIIFTWHTKTAHGNLASYLHRQLHLNPEGSTNTSGATGTASNAQHWAVFHANKNYSCT